MKTDEDYYKFNKAQMEIYSDLMMQLMSYLSATYKWTWTFYDESHHSSLYFITLGRDRHAHEVSFPSIIQIHFCRRWYFHFQQHLDPNEQKWYLCFHILNCTFETSRLEWCNKIRVRVKIYFLILREVDAI